MQIKRIELDQDVVQCPHCGALYLVTELEGGVRVQCISCSILFYPSDCIVENQ